MNLNYYETLVFDCDGVVLNSNQVKTQAFYLAALPYGEAAAQALVNYHVANGGISRYKKFSHFLEHMKPIDATGPDVDVLLSVYAHKVKEGLLCCEVAKGLRQLREKTPNARWLIVSGGDQQELREVFATRGLEELFDGGIFGSPDSKNEILARELAKGNIKQSALFIGDSRYDHQASTQAGLDFVFVSQWTEFHSWQAYCQAHQIKTVNSISNLLVER